MTRFFVLCHWLEGKCLKCNTLAEATMGRGLCYARQVEDCMLTTGGWWLPPAATTLAWPPTLLTTTTSGGRLCLLSSSAFWHLLFTALIPVFWHLLCPALTTAFGHFLLFWRILDAVNSGRESVGNNCSVFVKILLWNGYFGWKVFYRRRPRLFVWR